MIQLKHLHTFAGANPFSTDPVIVVQMLPEPGDAGCSINRFKLIRERFKRWSPAPFSREQLDEQGMGDYLASLAQWLLNDVRGFIRVAQCLPDSTGMLLILGYHEPGVSMRALQIAAQLFEKIDSDDATNLEQTVIKFGALCRSNHPDYQATILMQAAYSLDVPVLPLIQGSKFWQYGWGKRSRTFFESLSNADGSIASVLAENKLRSKAFFFSLGIPTPKSQLISTIDEIPAAVEPIGYPCVLKPLDWGGGKGVTANLRAYDHVVRAFKAARHYSAGPLMLEQFLQGEDHRLMVVDGQFMGAFRREPAHVIGDGARTIRQLIDAINESRSVSLASSQYLRPIPMDQVLADHLAAQGLTLHHTPETRNRVSLRSNANLSTGGIAVDVSAKVHESIKTMVEMMAESAGFGTAGFDYITTDITQNPGESGGAFIEMNTTPGIDIAINAGWQVIDIGTRILGKSVGRIPIDIHVVKQSPEALSLNRLPEPARQFDAMVSGLEIHVGKAIFKVQNNEPWAAVRAALRNKSVESLLIVCTIEEILAHGLPVDRISRFTTDGVTLPDAWTSVVNACSAEVTGK